MTDHYEEILDALAHEIWAVAQLAPGEGIVDGVARIAALLRKAPHPAITHCDTCGCDWLDNGLNPVSCPYCKPSAESEALRAEVDVLKAENARLRDALEEIRNRSSIAVMRYDRFDQPKLEVVLADICLFVDAVLWKEYLLRDQEEDNEQ